MSGKQAKKARGAIAARTYWHGGPAGLEPGSILVPLTTLLELPATARLQHPWYNDMDYSHVCATTDRALARDFAASWNSAACRAVAAQLSPSGKAPARDPWERLPQAVGGAVYRVVPLGVVSRDPDYPPGVSFRMPRARIEAVEEADVPHRDRASVEVLQYQRWDDGSPIYDADGYGQPSPEMRALGITAADLRPTGVAADPAEITQRAHQLLRVRHGR